MAYELVSAYSVCAIRVSQYACYNFFVCGPKLSRRLKKIDEEIPISPEVIGAHALNFKPKFKFLQLFLGGDLVPVAVYASKPWAISNTCKILYVDPFWRYSRSKSKVVRNRAEICPFFGPPKF